MTERELTFVLSEGEGQFLEYKERPDKSLVREMVAFANASGGRIFLGVSDDSHPIGISIDNRLKSQIQDVARNCDPPVLIELLSVGNILIVEVPESDNRPHACSDGFFMRIGANAQKLNRDEVFSMGIQSGRLRFDEQCCDRFNFPGDVGQEKVMTYLNAVGLSPELPLQEVLTNLEVLRVEGSALKMTNAGVLLFAENPERFLKSAPVVCAVYQDDDKVRILDRKIFNEGVFGNIRESVNYIRRHVDVRLDITSMERTEIPQYPEAALREVIVNAMMHRDYFDMSGDVMIEIFKTRILVSNPGGLVSWLRPEDFGKYSRTRNRLLASMLMRTPYAEKMGTGVLRINRVMSEAGLPEALFSFDEHNFSVALFSSLRSERTQKKDSPKSSPKGSPKSSPKTAQRILELVRKDSTISASSMGKKLGISKRSVIKQTNHLQETGKLRRVGAPRGGHWEIQDA